MNHALTAPSWSRKDGEHVARRLVEHVGVVEDRAERGEGHVGQDGGEDQQGCGELWGSCPLLARLLARGDPGDEDVVRVVDEVVARERVDELALAAPVRGRRSPRAGGRGSSPRRPRPARGARRRRARTARPRRGSAGRRCARRLDDRRDGASSPTTSRRSRALHAARRGALRALTRADTAVDSRGVRDLGAGSGRGQARRPAACRCRAARRPSCSCASRSRPACPCAPTGSSTTCGPAPPTQPQHAAVEGRAAAAGAGRSRADRAARTAATCSRSSRTRSTRCACCATPPRRRGGSTPATIAAPPS